MDRRTFLTGTAALATVGLSGCMASSNDEGEYDVGMTSRAFNPSDGFTGEVTVGTTVTWKNTSAVPHTVTAYQDEIPADATYFASGGFDGEEAARESWPDTKGAIASGNVYEHTFETPGEYAYFCIPHEPAGMRGTITVTEE